MRSLTRSGARRLNKRSIEHWFWNPPHTGGPALTKSRLTFLVQRYHCPQNAISVAFLTSRWKAGVPVPAGGGKLILKSL